MSSILILLLSIVFLIVLVSVFKIHPIPVLLFAGLLVGVLNGSSVNDVTESILSGFGGTLKWIGLIIFFGTLLGEILAKTGGADLIATKILSFVGPKYLPFGVAIIGFLIGIPVFMDVAYLTLLPTLLILSKRSGHSVLTLGLTLAMSLTVSHALIPPTPGPLAVAAMLDIEIANIIPGNVFVALFATAGGLTWLRLRSKSRGNEVIIKSEETQEEVDGVSITGFKKALPFMSILFPLILMTIGSFYQGDIELINFIKNPLWALIIGVFISLPLIPRNGFIEKLNSYFQSTGSKSAIVILITGAGGAFGQVIKDSGIVDTLLTQSGEIAKVSLLVPYAFSLLFTSVTGSITVSLLTASSLVAPLVKSAAISPEIASAAICAGSLAIIHVNSSFFWLFKEMHQLSISRVLKSLSVLSLVVSLSGLFGVWLLSLFTT